METDRYRCRKIIKFIFTLIVVMTLTSKGVLALEIKDYLDEFILTALQVSAVTTDMDMYLGWYPEEKESIKEASEKAIEDLEDIESRLNSLKLPKKLVKLKEANLKLIDKLKEIYTGIETKSDEEIRQGFFELNELYAPFQGKLESTLEKNSPPRELPENFEPLNEELKLIQNEEDKTNYLNAIKLIKGKKYFGAYEILNQLRTAYKNLAFEDCVLLKMSDCLLLADFDSEIKKENQLQGERSGLELLTEILNKKRYSPVLYEAFYKWRTIEQYLNYGVSNTSEIPNKAYNEKRWEIIQLIKEYAKDNPDDLWAQAQVDLLRYLPNILRGGIMGNDSLEHWGNLYVDFSGFKQESE